MRLLAFVLTVANLVMACTPTGFRPGPSDEYAFTNKENASPEEVRKILLICGEGKLLSNVRVLNGESPDNARARVIECMFAKGFFSKNGDGGYCADPGYRAKLPACANAPVRSRWGYYGQ